MARTCTLIAVTTLLDTVNVMGRLWLVVPLQLPSKEVGGGVGAEVGAAGVGAAGLDEPPLQATKPIPAATTRERSRRWTDAVGYIECLPLMVRERPITERSGCCCGPLLTLNGSRKRQLPTGEDVASCRIAATSGLPCSCVRPRCQFGVGFGRLSSWIYRITFNTAMSRLRGMRAARALETDEPVVVAETGHVSRVEPPDWSNMADERILRRQMRSRLAEAVVRLPAIYRAPVILRDFRGLSTEEASVALRVKDQTLKSRLHRGRTMLRRQLDDFAGAVARRTFCLTTPWLRGSAANVRAVFYVESRLTREVRSRGARGLGRRDLVAPGERFRPARARQAASPSARRSLPLS